MSKSEKDTRADSITITTAHSAKGLEWIKVYVMDISQGNFTECRQDQWQINDEQIRLLYVTVSRAMEELVLIHQNIILSSKKEKRMDSILEKIVWAEGEELFERSLMVF